MKRTPYFLLASLLSVGVLVILNRKALRAENERSEIAHAQTLVSSGENKPDQLNEALKITSQFVKRDPLHTHALFVQGWALQRLGRPKEALAAYDTLLPQLIELGKYGSFNSAVLLEATGKTEDALRRFFDAVTWDPQMEIAWVRAAALLRNLGRMEEARDTVEQGLANLPQGPMLLQIKSELPAPQPTP